MQAGPLLRRERGWGGVEPAGRTFANEREGERRGASRAETESERECQQSRC